MAKNSTSPMKFISIALMVIGIGLAFWGYQTSGGMDSQLAQTFSGSPTDKVMMLYIGGAASFIVGLYFFIRK